MCLVNLFGGFLPREEGCRPRQEEGSGSRDPDKPALAAAPERLFLEGRKHRDLGL